MLRIGIDTGGTFTDFVVLDDVRLTIFKLPSTPEHPERAVLDGLARIVGDRQDYLLQHGSTVATNALLERKGAKTLLVTNQGFEDILEIGRQNRPGLYSLKGSRPEPLVPARYRVGLRERTLWDKTSLVPLEDKRLERLNSKIDQLKPDSIAVVLLYSYLNPESEQRIGDVLSKLDIPFSLSHQILPEFREYERMSTTVINAYVQPIMSRYLSALTGDERVARGKLTIMQSNGGSIAPASASREPVRTLLSGPAGGVVGAFEVAREAGYDRIITLDMGGTSTDVCLCDQTIATTTEAQIDSMPIAVQMLGIHTVGAGGGSIAWIDEGGLVKVGPESAGADPGPVCYGKGNRLTVTDANLFLGRMDPDYFLGGELKLYPERVQEELQSMTAELEKMSGRSWSPEELAEGIIQIINTQMEGALRIISLQKGYDTRHLTLVTFGGAGGLHACALARSLMIPRILIPLNPGTLSAAGILRSDVVRDASLTVMANSSDPDLHNRIAEAFEQLAREVYAQLNEQGFVEEQITLEKSLDCRYLGQSWEINTPFGESFIDEFHNLHERNYGYSNRHLPLEVVNLRLSGRACYSKPPFPTFELEGEDPPIDSMIQEKQIILDGDQVRAGFYLRNKLRPGNRLKGPAVILEYSGTTLVPTDFELTVDRALNLLMTPKHRT